MRTCSIVVTSCTQSIFNLLIRHVNQYSAMHLFGNPGHTQSMIAYMIIIEYFGNSCKIALWECPHIHLFASNFKNKNEVWSCMLCLKNIYDHHSFLLLFICKIMTLTIVQLARLFDGSRSLLGSVHNTKLNTCIYIIN